MSQAQMDDRQLACGYVARTLTVSALDWGSPAGDASMITVVVIDEPCPPDPSQEITMSPTSVKAMTLAALSALGGMITYGGSAHPVVSSVVHPTGPCNQQSGRFVMQPPRPQGRCVRRLRSRFPAGNDRNAGQIRALGLGRRHGRIAPRSLYSSRSIA